MHCQEQRIVEHMLIVGEADELIAAEAVDLKKAEAERQQHRYADEHQQADRVNRNEEVAGDPFAMLGRSSTVGASPSLARARLCRDLAVAIEHVLVSASHCSFREGGAFSLPLVGRVAPEGSGGGSRQVTSLRLHIPLLPAPLPPGAFAPGLTLANATRGREIRCTAFATSSPRPLAGEGGSASGRAG